MVYRVPEFYRVTATPTSLPCGRFRCTECLDFTGLQRQERRPRNTFSGVPSAWILQGYSKRVYPLWDHSSVYRVPGFYRVTASSMARRKDAFTVYRVPGSYRVTAFQPLTHRRSLWCTECLDHTGLQPIFRLTR